MPRRLLALLAAVAMVGGSLLIRGFLDRREEDKANPPDLVCVAELSEFCKRIADAEPGIIVRVEAAGDTAARVAAQNGAEGIDAWLTTAPWPAIAEQRRELRGLPDLFTSADYPVLARSPVVLAVWPDREGVMRKTCGVASVSFKCIGTVAGKQSWDAAGGRVEWGPVKVSMGDPEAGVLGSTAFAGATAEYFGKADLATLDFDNDDYRDWVSGLKRSTPLATRVPRIDDVLATGPSVTDVFVGFEADVLPAVEKAARTVKPAVLYPSPVVTADLVLARTPGRAGERLDDIVRGAVDDHLADMGWRTPDEQTTLPPIPPGSGLPDPGVIDALRQVWKEAAG